MLCKVAITLLVLFTANALASCPDFFGNQTACSCYNYNDGLIIRCSGQDGPAVVEQLKKSPLEIRELALEDANIIEIGKQAFKNLRIKKLILDNNRIRALHPDAFRGLESAMVELSISHNKLDEIPTDSLTSLYMLSVLSLKCNKIGDLKGTALKNMTNLIDLNLACNQICNIEGHAFYDVKHSLQNLILDNNCLSTVPTEALANLDNLIGLHMKNNEIEMLGKQQLTNMSSLTILSLNGNKINTVEENVMMPHADNLRYLYLGSNNITSLEGDALRQFDHVQVIDLSYNYLDEITNDMFSGLEHLQHLNLEGNRIKIIASGAFATTPLLLLWLPNNCLSSVSPNIFQGAPFLRQVSLSNNNIRAIQPLSFAHLANLHTLDLSHNKIQSLEPSAIIGSDYLTVRLQENPMVCLQDGFHVMNGKEAINLTTEPNFICRTNFTGNQDDRCPKNNYIPFLKPCCNKSSAQNSLEPTRTKSLGTVTHFAQSTTAASSVQHHNIHDKKFNLDRFLRLSRRPPGYRTSPFLRYRAPIQSVPANTSILDINSESQVSVNNRPTPSRVEQRQKQFAKIRARLPPYIRTEPKNKGEMVEFVSDSQVDMINIHDRISR